jgi:uncharacterized repeat protein (TIGR04138 family)
MSAQWAVDRKILELVRTDGRYGVQAYAFVFEALDFAMQRFGRDRRRKGDRHLSVPDLVTGMRDFAIEQYGPLARVVMQSMGVFETADFGEIVFALVDKGLLNKQDSDTKEQFAQVFDFREAFAEPELLARTK